MKKSVLCFAMLLVLLFSVVSPAFAAQIGGDKVAAEDFTDIEKWEGDSATFSKRNINSQSSVLISNKDEAPVSVTYETDTKKLSAYTEMNLSVIIKCESANSLTVTGLSEASNTTFTYSVDIEESGSLSLHIPINADSVDKIRLETASAVTSFVVSDISFDNEYTYIYREHFNSYSVSAECDKSTIDGEKIILGTSTTASFSPKFQEAHGEAATYLATLSLISSAEGKIGIFTDTDNKTSAGQTMGVGEGKYYFLVFGAFDNLTFTFTTEGQPLQIALCDASLTKIGTYNNNEYGKISSCVATESGLTVSGSLAGDALTKFIGSDLLVFSSEIGAEPEISRDNAIAKSAYSTRFEISVSGLENYKNKLYYVYIDSFLGLVPVGSPAVISSEYDVYSNGKTDTAMALSYDGDITDFIYSGADSLLFSVNTSDALMEGGSYSDITRRFNSVSYSFNPDFCDRVEKNAEILSKYGKTAYYKVSADTDSFEEYLAVLDYLRDKATGLVICDLSEYADTVESLAVYYSVAVGVVKSSSPDVYTSLEISSNDFIADALTLRYYMSLCKIRATGFYIENADLANTQKHLSRALVSAGLDVAPLCGFNDNGSLSYNDAEAAASASGYVFCATDGDTSALGEGWPKMKEGAIAVNVPEYYKALIDYTSSYDTSGWTVSGGFRLPTTEAGEEGKRFAQLQSTENPGLAIYTFSVPVNCMDGMLGIKLNKAENAEGAEFFVTLKTETDVLRYRINTDNIENNLILLDMSELSDKALCYISIEKTDSRALTLCIDQIGVYTDNEETAEKLDKTENGSNNFMLYATIVVSVVTLIVFLSVLLYKKHT